MDKVECMRFEFSQDRVSKKNSRELGEYIAGMKGDDRTLSQIIALVDAIKGYNKADGEAFQSSFWNTRALNNANDE